MKIESKFLLLIFLVCSNIFSKPTPILVKESIKSIVTVNVYDSKDQEIATGSGFIISSDGYAVTNYHVIDGATKLELVLYNGAIFRDISLSTVDKNLDIAILKFAGTNLDSLKLNRVEPVLGSKIIVIGSPLGFEKTVSEGIVSGFRNFDGFDHIQMTAPISHGSSGGPAIDRFGNVIGIVQSFMKDAQAINFLIPSKYILKLYDRKAELGQLKKPTEEEKEVSDIPSKTLYPKDDLSGAYTINYSIICNETSVLYGVLVIAGKNVGLIVVGSDPDNVNDRKVFKLEKLLSSNDGNVMFDFGTPFDGYQTDVGFIAQGKPNLPDSPDCKSLIMKGNRFNIALSESHGAYDTQVRSKYYYQGNPSSDVTDWAGSTAVVFANDSIFIDIYLANSSGGNTSGYFKGPVDDKNDFNLKSENGKIELSGSIKNGTIYADWEDYRSDEAFFKGTLIGNRK